MTEIQKRIKELYQTHTSDEIAQIIGSTKSSVKNQAFKMGLKKAYNSGQFHKGGIPQNKGKKMDQYLSPEKVAKIKQTCFKKGQSPHNTKQIGDTRKTKHGYWRIKVASHKWEYLHRKIFLEANPGIVLTKNDTIEFVDGNKDNCSMSNLRLVSRAESANRAFFHARNIARFITKDKQLQDFIIEKNPAIIELQRKLINRKKIQDDNTRETRKTSGIVR